MILEPALTMLSLCHTCQRQCYAAKHLQFGESLDTLLFAMLNSDCSANWADRNVLTHAARLTTYPC